MSKKEASKNKPTDGSPLDVKPEEIKLQKEISELEQQRLENFEKKLEIRSLDAKAVLEASRHDMEKINALRWLLSDSMLDTENTQLGSEPKYKLLFSDADQDIIRKKIMDLVKKL